MENIECLTVKDFLVQIALPTFPGPASGSVSATTAAMAASLLEMGIKITMRKDEKQCSLAKNLDYIENIRAQCISLATEDIEAYQEVIKASKSRKTHPEEFEVAMKNATETLVAIVRYSNIIITELEHLINTSYIKVLGGDLGGSAYMAEAAAAAAKLGVEINLRLIQDESYKTKKLKSINENYENCVETKERILSMINN